LVRGINKEFSGQGDAVLRLDVKLPENVGLAVDCMLKSGNVVLHGLSFEPVNPYYYFRQTRSKEIVMSRSLSAISVLLFVCLAATDLFAWKTEAKYALGPQCTLDFPSGGHWYNLGPTGARGAIYEDAPTVFVIKYVFPGSPADSLLQLRDKVIGANGKKFKESENFGAGLVGPERELGAAIEESEGDPKLKGVLTFMVVRDGKSITVPIKLKQLGYFSKNFPYDCKKSEILVKDGCEFLVKEGCPFGIRGNYFHNTTALCNLALMAQGNTYKAKLKENYEKQVANNSVVGGMWSWVAAIRTIELAEWYLISKDQSMIPLIQAHSDILVGMQAPKGGFQHHVYRVDGYAIMALNTAKAGIAWALMKQGGLKIPEYNYLKARNALVFNTKEDGSIGYGLYDVPDNWKPSTKKINPSDGTKGERTDGACAAASILQYLDPMDSFSDGYYKRGIKRVANGTWYMGDGHASALTQMQWGFIAAGLGTVVDDMASYRAVMDYWKYWFNVNRCHDGSFYFPPCEDSQVDPFSDVRFIPTGMAILALSVPKHKLAILGRDPVIPGVDKTVLSALGLQVYNQIKSGKVTASANLAKLATLKKSAKDDQLAALDVLEEYVSRPIKEKIEEIKTIAAENDLYKLSEELKVNDALYKGVAEYDRELVPFRNSLSGTEAQKLMAAGKIFYSQIASRYKEESFKNVKKGVTLQVTKEFIVSNPPEPYLKKAKSLVTEVVNDLNDGLTEILKLKNAGDIFLANKKLLKLDSEYGAFSSYAVKAAILREGINTPENKKKLLLGELYYKLIEPAHAPAAALPTSAKVLQGLDDFIRVNPDVEPYVSMAQQLRETKISDMEFALNAVSILLIGGDVYQASKQLASLDKDYGVYPVYCEKVVPVRAAISTPSNKALVKAGALYYAMEDAVNKKPGPPAQKRVAAFIKANASNYYGEKAQSLVKKEAK